MDVWSLTCLLRTDFSIWQALSSSGSKSKFGFQSREIIYVAHRNSLRLWKHAPSAFDGRSVHWKLSGSSLVRTQRAPRKSACCSPKLASKSKATKVQQPLAFERAANAYYTPIRI